MQQCLIIEDEPEFSTQLSEFVGRTQIMAPPIICTTAMTALQAMSTNQIDLLFLDINLPDMSGLELIKALPGHPAIIITSSYSSRAVDCFDLEVVDFLHKPYDYNRFLRALSRAMVRTTPAVPVVVPEPVKETAAEKDMIFFKSGRRIERFRYDDILYIEAYGLYSKVHTASGTVAISKRISAVLDSLMQDRFIRIHKSFIINITYLKRLELKQVWIKEQRLPIGITYRPSVHQKMVQLGIREKVVTPTFVNASYKPA